jgi:diaminopimelate epimerase
MRFAKGHGTGNDFVILPDPDGRLDLSPRLVARMCDRRTGLGADGILRVVRSKAAADTAADAGPWAQQAADQGAEWFMDYRNADGSIAEMCGNGIRVFARYLLDHDLADGPELAIGTRAGVRRVRDGGLRDASADRPAGRPADHSAGHSAGGPGGGPGGELTAEMGPAVVTGHGRARIGGRACDGLAISVGNPHLACLTDFPVADFDLSAPPALDQGQFPDGANVEVLRVTAPRHVEMRVYERGSGATLSCGTGAVATAVAAAVAAGEWQAGTEHSWTVDVPGGRLTVTPSATASLLAGPAVIVAAGELDDDWVRG